MDELATALTALRKRAGITRERMAAELSIDPAEVIAVENGSRVFATSRFVSDWSAICSADAEEPHLLELYINQLDRAEAVTA